MKERDCAFCKGTGKVKLREFHGNKITDDQRLEAVKLIQSGMTYRAAAKKLGFKSPQSIASMIKVWNRNQ